VINPNDPETYNLRGEVFLLLGHYTESINDFTMTLHINKKHPVAHYNRGYAYQSTGDYRAAMKDYEKALEINSSFAEVYFEIGNILAIKGKYEEAIQQFDKSIGLKPDFAKVYIARGLAKFKTGDQTDGCNDLTKAKELGDKAVDSMIQFYCVSKKEQEGSEER
jgi:tetratricopeptide (TPR) repeat protein